MSTRRQLRTTSQSGIARLATFAVLSLFVAPVYAITGCGSLGPPATSWDGTTGNFAPGSWTFASPGGSTNACIINGTSATPSVVNLVSGNSEAVLNLQLGANNSLNIVDNSDLAINGSQIINAGALNVTSTSSTGTLDLANNVTLSGSGTLTLTSVGHGGAFIEGTGAFTLTNSSTIQGTGFIGAESTLAVTNSGTINANGAAGVLSLGAGGGLVTNTGVLEATGGSLELQSTVNNAGGTISANATGNVAISSTIQGGALNAGGPNGNFTISTGALLDGETHGTLTIGGGADIMTTTGETTQVQGQIANSGLITVRSTNTNTLLTLAASTTFSGNGTINLNSELSGASAILNGGSSVTLTNGAGHTIQGSGVIGNGGMTVTNAGTINANQSSGALNLQGISQLTNTGLLEATGSGTLNVTPTVINGGGTIESLGGSSLVQLGTVQGGTLTTKSGGTITVGALDGSTAQGALTLSTGSSLTESNGGTLQLAGSIINNGTIQLSSGNGNNTYLAIGGPFTTTTLSGSGTINLTSVATGGGVAGIEQSAHGSTLVNQSNTIQGAGDIGGGGSAGMTFVNGGTVNANIAAGVNGSTGVLYLDGQSPIGGQVTNTGTLEATNGGSLIISNTVVNTGGNITANGSGSSVTIESAIEGGTLTTLNGGTITGSQSLPNQVGGTTALLDGSTAAGAVTINSGSTFTVNADNTAEMNGSIVNNGTIQLNTANEGDRVELRLLGTTTLSGGGTVNLTNVTFAQAILDGATLINQDNTIQGAGSINSGLVNGGIVNANIGAGVNNSTGILSISSTTNSDGSSGGLLEATNGGQLQIGSTINNANGNISASGAGSSVVLSSATIQGGTLNTTGGGSMSAYNSTFDGVTQGTLTISSGSTLTLANNTTNYAVGTITNQGNIVLSGGGEQTGILQITSINGISDLTLNGGGTVTLSQQSGGGTATISEGGGDQTLINVNNTIQGVGEIGNNGLSVTNQAGGTLLANIAGGTLLLDGTGTLTNAGTMQVNAGSTLHSQMGLAATTFNGNTLLTGTYNIYGTSLSPGTLRIDALGTGGGEIANNAATILLSGVNSNFEDANGNDALSALSGNSGSLSILNGRNLTTLGIFSNTGFMDIGTGSIFTVGDPTTYSQTQGTTDLDGILDASLADITGGMLTGSGFVDGDLTVDNGATLTPGDGLGNTLTVNGDYDQTSTGNLLINLASLNAYDILDINGNADFGGTLTLDAAPGFTLALGDTFSFIDYSSGEGTFSNIDASGLNLASGLAAEVVYDQGDPQVELEIVASPEPGTWFLFACGLGALAAFKMARVTAPVSSCETPTAGTGARPSGRTGSEGQAATDRPRR